MIYRERYLMQVEGVEEARLQYNRYCAESADSPRDLSPVLRVRLRAITANKVTRNRTFYPIEELEGDGQTKGYITVLKPYPIPILLDHRATSVSMLASGDMPIPVGRAVDARVVRRGRRREGYLEIDAVIHDRRVMEFILDGRFMTVSIGQIPGRVECSVCGLPVEGMECSNGHVRGNTYEWNGELKSCYHVMRDLEFVEVSFVNVPSDSDAIILSKSLDSGTLTSGGLEMADLSHIHDGEGAVCESAEQSVLESVEQSAEQSVSASADEVAQEQSEVGDVVLSEGDHLGVSGGDVMGSDDDSEVPAQDLYLIDGEIPFPEAKLTAAQRRRLPDSAFCGPNRSFPVHDRPHVLAALRLLGRAKLSPAQKARVRACVLRKARAMGMKVGQDRDGESVLVYWVVPESRLDVLEFELSELRGAVLESARVLMAYDGTVLLELPDEQFDRLREGVIAPAESVSDEVAELRHMVHQLEMELQEWKERALAAEARLNQLGRENLVTRAVGAAIAAGYPAALNRSAEELYRMFSERSDEFLRTLLEDLSSASLTEVARGLTDVKNPLEGVDVGQVHGSVSSEIKTESPSASEQPARRFNAVEELLSALKSGELGVSEDDGDDAEIYRIFMK